ncbi:MAG: sensor histidine kinase [Gemmatimonadaceae bacterium]|nr:sensor histidine kinase [Gemmatimonadaceae bacterium]
MTSLSQFIRDNTEPILVEWEAFARALPVAGSMDIVALRDHAKEMLTCIASDLDTPQTGLEQAEKAKGKSDADESGTPNTAAQEHGGARAESGFTVSEMLSELRALRASVIRLWTKEQRTIGVADLEDVIRFNEAIDQAIAESITQYSDDIGYSKERFLAILGHDLRTPLGAILMSASFMLETGELAEPHLSLAKRIARGARRMNHMVADLLNFTQTTFGQGIPIVRAAMDVPRMIHDVVAEIVALYPAAKVEVDVTGDVRGQWDAARLTQALTNLVGNAVQHGAKGAPIQIAAVGMVDEVTIAVHNEGSVIPEAQLPSIFKAGRQSAATGASDDHLGLGLYIVDRIVVAHGGSIDVRSTSVDGTTFTVHLPRSV